MGGGAEMRGNQLQADRDLEGQLGRPEMMLIVEKENGKTNIIEYIQDFKN